jgi:WhiB family transcriptional regulator, redox-sensing transcriptional regulator
MPSAPSSIPVRPPAALDEPLPCHRVHGDLWFSELPAELEQAKAHCRRCPLRTACLAGALERAEPCGVWGGEIFHAGAIIARKRPRGRPPRTRPDADKGHSARPNTHRGDHASDHPSAAGC